MIRALPNRNGREFQTIYIRARSGTDSAQWDWGISNELPCIAPRDPAVGRPALMALLVTLLVSTVTNLCDFTK